MLLQMSIMEPLVAWPGTIGGAVKREEERWILAMLRGRLGKPVLPGTGSEGEGGAGMTQSCWFGQMAGQWCHLLS